MPGITLGGRQPGSLTHAAIKKLTVLYYGRAFLDSQTVEDMRNAIWATIFHCYSTDDYPRHQFCPQGENSWSFYKNAEARKQFPGDPKNHMHTKLDRSRLHAHLKPVYERLSHPDLLTRCLGHKTQNSNESLNNKIWSKCNKL
ncbi:hypothetical protein ElyMa_005066000 [Elysia marginata]|uniref:Uncharacterized protein n=1 Tax=Elysia marginata TaxID=1093978 RepID=A0AAV4JDR1_9GAST|nr:hypothetical protein ElyMa_005066000 [Elysia marginata]